MLLTPDKWHLLSITHLAGEPQYGSAGIVSVSVDGSLEMQHDLIFPFPPAAPVEDSLWVFGQGLCGAVASVAYYKSALPLELLQLMHEQGPHQVVGCLGIDGVAYRSDSTTHCSTY